MDDFVPGDDAERAGRAASVVVALIASAALSIVQVAAVKSGGGVSIVGIVLMARRSSSCAGRNGTQFW